MNIFTEEENNNIPSYLRRLNYEYKEISKNFNKNISYIINWNGYEKNNKNIIFVKFILPYYKEYNIQIIYNIFGYFPFKPPNITYREINENNWYKLEIFMNKNNKYINNDIINEIKKYIDEYELTKEINIFYYFDKLLEKYENIDYKNKILEKKMELEKILSNEYHAGTKLSFINNKILDILNYVNNYKKTKSKIISYPIIEN